MSGLICFHNDYESYSGCVCQEFVFCFVLFLMEYFNGVRSIPLFTTIRQPIAAILLVMDIWAISGFQLL